MKQRTLVLLLVAAGLIVAATSVAAQATSPTAELTPRSALPWVARAQRG